MKKVFNVLMLVALAAFSVVSPCFAQSAHVNLFISGFHAGFVIFIIFFAWLQWVLGKLIGKKVSRTTGLVLGVILVLSGALLIMGIACIIYSQKNENAAININSNINANVNHQNQSDTMECPHCSETIKKNAKVCRYCNHTL